MNQLNQSLPSSTDNRPSEQSLLIPIRSKCPDELSACAESNLHAVEVFAVGTENKILGERYAVRQHAEQSARHLDADQLFLHREIRFFSSEFSKARQELLSEVIGATRGTFFVAQGGDGHPLQYHLIGPRFQSLEQAEAWRYLSLPYYPECQVVQDESGGFEFSATNQSAINHVSAFSVVAFDAEQGQSVSIADRYFTTEADARRYQLELLPDYPDCNIVQSRFRFNGVRHRQEILEVLFDEDSAFARAEA
ncbi:hypothetical protein BJL95_04570 [Methylomonas sp. LWB]|uniref:hypothetical protein n=1 Tax=Methylomonas sp. LWB TaxID=1905845 RepID=UPI0008DAFDBF|nr:hypothetical protein [Methylomonas sp. LWB]OHX37851.1 hypothetical protein BJL95_04570 [Methylomonas sp. LWB]